MTATRHLSGSVVPVPEGAGVPGSHLPWCFGCGEENDRGLGLTPDIEGDRVVADIEFAPWFQGGPGLVHGGAVAGFFDDLMGFVPIAHETPAVTAKLETNFLRPIPLGMTLRGEAWLAERDGRKLWVEAIGRIGDDHYVECRGLWLAIGPEHFVQALARLSPHQAERVRYHEGEYYP